MALPSSASAVESKRESFRAALMSQLTTSRDGLAPLVLDVFRKEELEEWAEALGIGRHRMRLGMGGIRRKVIPHAYCALGAFLISAVCKGPWEIAGFSDIRGHTCCATLCHPMNSWLKSVGGWKRSFNKSCDSSPLASAIVCVCSAVWVVFGTLKRKLMMV